jgi:hypothetical protein
MQKVEAGKSGADHGDIDLLGLSGGIRSACCDHRVWHAIPPEILVCRQAIAAPVVCHPFNPEELQKPRAAACARKSAAPQQRGVLDFSA